MTVRFAPLTACHGPDGYGCPDSAKVEPGRRCGRCEHYARHPYKRRDLDDDGIESETSRHRRPEFRNRRTR